MKVLNWVTQRLLNVQSCTCVLPDEEMESRYMNSKFDVEETQALLEHGGHMVMDVLEDWKDGILTIGTLGISPLDTSNFEIEEEDDVTDEVQHRHILDHETNPLTMNVTVFSHEVATEDGIFACQEIIEEQVSEIVVVAEIVQHNNDDDESAKMEDVAKTRVTLADLLSADSGHQLVKKLGDIKILHEADGVSKELADITDKPCMKKMIKPTSSRGKSGLSKAKKLLKEDLHPLKKLNQFMKRMIKKKIHPDLEGKLQEDTQKESDNQPLNPTNVEGGGDSI